MMYRDKKDIKLTDLAYHVWEMVLYCIMDELKKFYYSSKQQWRTTCEYLRAAFFTP